MTPRAISAAPAKSAASLSELRATTPAAISPATPSSAEDPAGRQQQLGEQQADPDQRDDDEGFHRSDYPPCSA